MNLAITLLVVIAIASVIGTVLQQNQPYPNYALKLGPFWFEVFRCLGLYDVYSNIWFICVLAFLVISISVCLCRQVPILLLEMVKFHTKVQIKSLLGLQQSTEWLLIDRNAKQILAKVTGTLISRDYSWRLRDYGTHQVVAAVKGRYNRLGYILTHMAVVLISIGGLLDSDFWLKLKEWQGQIAVERRYLPFLKPLPQISKLQPGALPTFRGNVMLPEGSTTNFVFLSLYNGFLVQELPFSIELKDFKVQYYETGQPKAFISQIRILDQEHLGVQPLDATIRVNHPLVYRGYSIYQSNFGDGGSKLQLRVWPFYSNSTKWSHPLDLQGSVGNEIKLAGENGDLTIELEDLRLITLLPEIEASGRKFHNFGPSLSFKLRNAVGKAWEYLNYMVPVQLEGRLFYVSGVRTSMEEPFSYIYIPSANNSPERFLKLNACLHNIDWVRDVLAQNKTSMENGSSVRRDFEFIRLNLIKLFMEGGFPAVSARAKAVVPADQLYKVTSLYFNLLKDTLAKIFIEILREEGMKVDKGVGEREEIFFEDAISALTTMPNYGAPFYLQLQSFQQIEASGLQVTYSTGTSFIQIGFFLLVTGIFIMFYTSYRRIWVWLAVENCAVRLVLAGRTGDRCQSSFINEFLLFREILNDLLGTVSEKEE
jgi:cytochrome c biogenesis protein